MSNTSTDDVFQQIQKLIWDMFPFVEHGPLRSPEGITSEIRLADEPFKWDGLDFAELSLFLEKHFSIRFSDGEFPNMLAVTRPTWTESVGTIVEKVESMIRDKSSAS